MNAHALLTSQGWRGSGHSLHPTDGSIGLSRPLLLSRKDNKLGIGQKPHYTSDQWWLDTFDQKLKGLDTTSKKGTVVQTVTGGGLDAVAAGGGRHAGLYAGFVSGGMLEGTITPEESADSVPLSNGDTEHTTGAARTRKERTKEERRARREARRMRRMQREAERAAKLADSSREEAEGGDETEAVRRARRAERRARKEEKRKRKEEKKLGDSVG